MIGIYIPTLAFQVYNYNVAKPAVPINIKGILVSSRLCVLTQD